MKREPAMLAGLVAAAVALLVYYGVLDREGADLWQGLLLAAIALAQAWYTRQRVMPVDTIREAGLTPEAVHARAADPSVPRADK